jgi:hypothetical protein
MSYSKPSGFTSPTVCDIEWAGSYDKGYLTRYDKEKKENVTIEGDFGFIELDSRHAVRGFHSPTRSGISSTEVDDISSESMRVFRFDNGKTKTIAEGIYKEIKGEFQSAGGKYAKIVYAVVTKSTDNVAHVGSTVRIIVKGSFLGPYIDTAKPQFEVTVSGFEEKKNGGTSFRAPKLGLSPVDAAQDKLAMDADEELQKFFLEYKRSKNSVQDVGEELGAALE